jgi:hypothetical protein
MPRQNPCGTPPPQSPRSCGHYPLPAHCGCWALPVACGAPNAGKWTELIPTPGNVSGIVELEIDVLDIAPDPALNAVRVEILNPTGDSVRFGSIWAWRSTSP